MSDMPQNKALGRKALPPLTEEQIELACEKLYEGHISMSDIADLLCVSLSWLNKQRLKDPNLDTRLMHAQRLGMDSLAEMALKIPDEYEDTNRARLKVDTIKWYLAKRKPEVYGDRIDVNINQTVDIGGALTEARNRTVVEVSKKEVGLISTRPISDAAEEE